MMEFAVEKDPKLLEMTTVAVVATATAVQSSGESEHHHWHLFVVVVVQGRSRRGSTVGGDEDWEEGKMEEEPMRVSVEATVAAVADFEDWEEMRKK